MNSNRKYTELNKTALQEPTARPDQASIFDVLRYDPMLELPQQWRELQIKDNQRWSRYFILPILKPVCIMLIWLIKIIKRTASIFKIPLESERLLNFLSLFFMNRFVSPEAQEMLLRHLSLENIILHFIYNNTSATDIDLTHLQPDEINQLGDVAGMNATLLHDTIILNFITNLGQSKDANLFNRLAIDDIDFSMLQVPDYKIDHSGNGKLINLDMESTIYIVVLFLVLLFSDKQMESSANSLFLDESVMKIISNITGDTAFRQWTITPFTSYLRMPFDLTDSLHKHIKIYEYAYHHLKQLQMKQK